MAALLKGRGIGNIKLTKAMKFTDSAKYIWECPEKELYELECLCNIKGLANGIIENRDKDHDLPNTIYEDCLKHGVNLITSYEEEYSPLLKETFDPPLVLFYQGDITLLGCRSVGIVGARKFSPYGESVAMEFATKLATAGLVITSGAARGIDTKAHKGALRAENGKTIAVLGCGLDIAYPAENRRLLAEIRERGLVLSEYTVGTQPLPVFFPLRNRIINGISEGVLVVEAAKHSGSLITADLAVSENRNLYAVPSSIYSPNSEGCHKLIREGAMLVDSPDNILEDMGIKPVVREIKNTLTPDEARIYRVLSFEKTMTIDEIIDSLPEVAVATLPLLLLQMELKGAIIDSNGYRRADRK